MKQTRCSLDLLNVWSCFNLAVPEKHIENLVHERIGEN